MEQFKKFVEPVAPLAQSVFEFIKTPIGITVLALVVLSSLVSAFAHHRWFDGWRWDFGWGCPMMQRMKWNDKWWRQWMMNHMQDKWQWRCDDQFQWNDMPQDNQWLPENRPQENQNPWNMPQPNPSQPSSAPSTGSVAKGN